MINRIFAVCLFLPLLASASQDTHHYLDTITVTSTLPEPFGKVTAEILVSRLDVIEEGFLLREDEKAYVIKGINISVKSRIFVVPKKDLDRLGIVDLNKIKFGTNARNNLVYLDIGHSFGNNQVSFIIRDGDYTNKSEAVLSNLRYRGRTLVKYQIQLIDETN